MSSEVFQLGMNAKLYYGDAGTKAATELTNVKDVSLSVETGEADVTTRANQGWQATAATLKNATLTFQMVFKPSDAGFAAIRNAWLNAAQIALLPLTAEETSGGEGPDADWSITQFSRNESLTEAITVDVTAKIAVYRDWVGGA